MTISIESVQEFVTREARYLDDKDWDAWLACYAPEAEFWMPAWDDDDALTEDTRREISLIYYPHRGGLEDRIFRIRTERSSATSLPEPRTSHNILHHRHGPRAQDRQEEGRPEERLHPSRHRRLSYLIGARRRWITRSP